jgi:hypothetical protein
MHLLPLISTVAQNLKLAMRMTILLLTLFVFCVPAIAQDVITLRDGKEMHVKVTEITPSEVKFKQKNETHTINKGDIVMISYKGGRKEYFSENHYEKKENNGVNKIDSISHIDDSIMAERGKADAKKFYKKYKNPESWTITTTFLASPAVGLIPAIMCSATPPNEKNLNCPYPDLLNTPAYGNAYREKAHKIKAGKTWIGYGIGTAICVAFVVFINSLAK